MGLPRLGLNSFGRHFFDPLHQINCQFLIYNRTVPCPGKIVVKRLFYSRNRTFQLIARYRILLVLQLNFQTNKKQCYGNSGKNDHCGKYS